MNNRSSIAIVGFAGLFALVALVWPVSAAAPDEKASGSQTLSGAGAAFEAARLKPQTVRAAALEEIADSMDEIVKGTSSGKRGAAHYLWGEILFASRDYEGAAEQYRKSEKSDGNESYADDAAFASIVALEASGRDEDASKEWIAWEKKYGKSSLLPEALLARTWNAVRRDTLPEAEHLYASLKERFPSMIDDTRVIMTGAALSYFAGQPREALQALTAITGPGLKSRKKSGAGHSADIEAASIYLRALCYQLTGEMLQAAAQFQEVVERYPESTLRDHAMLAKADIFLASRAYKSAAEEYAQVMKLASLPDVKAEAELRQAASVVLNGDASGGTDLLRKTLANHPKTPVGARAQYLLGEVLYSRSEYEKAIQEFNRVLTDYFEHSLAASAQYRVGKCLDALGRHAEATSSYQAVVSGYTLSPESPAAAYLAGVGLLAQSLPLAAAPYFQLVLDRYAHEDTSRVIVFASPEHQELVEASLCLLMLSYHRAGDLGQLSGVPHLMLQKMPVSTSPWRAYALLFDADALSSQGRYSDAQAVIDQLMKEFPGHHASVAATRLLAWTYAQEGRDDLAMETESQLLSRFGSTADTGDMGSAYLNKAHILFNKKEYKKAVASYEEFLQRFPSHEDTQLALYQAGLAYLRLGKTGNAVDKWEAVVAGDPASPIAERTWARAGDLYFQTEHYADAKRCYQGLLDNFSGTPVAAMAMLRLAQCDYNAGNDREALDGYSAVEARFPDSEVSAAAKKGLEQALYRLGQREDGSEILGELVERYPTSSFAADAQFEIAMRHYNAKRYGEAAEAFRRVVSQFPGYHEADKAHFLMAESYSLAGETQESRLAYEQFIKFFSESELQNTVRFRLGSLRFVEGDYMRAAIDFTSVLESPDLPKDVASASLYNLALCRRMLGEVPVAQSLLERYRQEYGSGDEREADVAFQLGDIHERAGSADLALEEYRKALACKPRPDLLAEIHYHGGSCLEQKGDDQEAIIAYRKAINAVEKDNVFRLASLVRCAALYEKTGNYAGALAAYRDLIQNASDDELVVAAKERVSQIEGAGK
jgi:TolA-binding protein